AECESLRVPRSFASSKDQSVGDPWVSDVKSHLPADCLLQCLPHLLRRTFHSAQEFQGAWQAVRGRLALRKERHRSTCKRSRRSKKFPRASEQRLPADPEVAFFHPQRVVVRPLTQDCSAQIHPCRCRRPFYSFV